MKKICLIILFIFISNPVFASETTLYFNSVERTFNDIGSMINEKVYLPAGNAIVLKQCDNGAIKQCNNPAISYLYPDHLGSTILVTDKNGKKTADYFYYPFGNSYQPVTSQLATNKLYTGQRKDLSSDLYFYNARYYNLLTGNFISADKAEGPNRYSYVGNNPVMRNDPTGNMQSADADGGESYFKKQNIHREREYISGRGGFFIQNVFDTVWDSSKLLQKIKPTQRMYVNDDGLRSEPWQNLNNLLDKEIGYENRSNKDYLGLSDIRKITQAIKSNIEFNKEIEANFLLDIEKGNTLFSGIRDSRTGYLAQGRIDEKLITGSNTCFDLAAYLHIYLGEKGIDTQFRAADIFFNKNPLFNMGHAFITFTDTSGVVYAADPTFGAVMTLDEYISGWKKGGPDTPKGNSFYMGPPISIYRNNDSEVNSISGSGIKFPFQ